ncbi:nucleotide exchange factor SIL1-like isoform X1 [Mizuhopecten yessoensis]|uniref:nucleotide exchange factor SIL1-like isoform X1 n=1 Tax=Mizuhopecten yessoensis TaxID=6573 RepID=UPI000B45BA00|nr:nucleotide exchange factor SIL1-like isoform X1 [Mizuhopecten yessoensis]XP_021375663.1 nucleotide exchange factor SIL1-like isoform X1 [Mizuhopecten yessoensis]XP_021375668.1 nucleotide exchange factor SIL1-like isoform X1 [Mizuhopecten yessoensis]
MMPLIKGLRVLNLLSVSLFLICCYHMLANTQKVPPGGDNIRNGGALTLVPQDPTDDADVTVENSEEIDEDVPSMGVFYPTKEWKTVKKGQAIPAGLHVRMNLETGGREAKLMEGDSENKYRKSGNKGGRVNPSQKSLTPQQLKEALKEFKTTKLDDQDNEVRKKEVFKSFRKYDELKKELADMNSEIKTDAEIVTQMFHRLNSTDLDGTQKKHLLEDLEYYLHQIDNANVFCNLGGMTLLMKGLNDSLALTREQSAFVIGSAVQSNPAAQIKALEAGILPQLIRLLSTEPEARVLPRLLYALSSLIRHFPYAQKHLLDLGGLAALKSMIPNNKDLPNLQVKVVTLLQDLIVEKDITLSIENKNKEKVQQYEMVHLRDAIREQGLCVWLPRLLEATDHDSREKVLQAMLTLTDTCREDISLALPTLKKLLQEYTHLAAGETDQDDQYFSGIVQYITQIISSSQRDSKDEL